MVFIPIKKWSLIASCKLMIHRKLNFFFWIILTSQLAFSSCGVYSFTGASIPPEAKTISIATFPNKAEIVQPSLSQTFTEKLKDRFSSQTSLSLIPRNGDLQLEGEITGYETEPIAISGDQQASMIRLKITVNVRFFNKFEPKNNYETAISRYQDYPSSQDLRTVEQNLIDLISNDLVEDIFNKSVVNW